ncbi:MAG: glycosyltransferase family 4 protein [Acidobacteriota bacterium]|nr:MAG: glycosyltransferase family 4 protein [Acidobacteriota bacterium]
MKRIALVSHLAAPGRLTGAEQGLLFLAAGLRGRGRDVLVVVPREGLLAEEARRQGCRVRVAPYPCLWLVGSRGFLRARELFHIARFLTGVRAWFRLRRVFREENVRLVHANTLVSVWPVLAARSLKLPVLWHAHETLAPGWRRHLFEALLDRLPQKTVCVSYAAMRALVRIPETRLQVVPIGVAVPPRRTPEDALELRRKLGLPAEGRFLLWVGHWEPHKGLEHFVQSLGILRRKKGIAGFRGVVLGEPRRERKLHAMRRSAARAGVAANIVWAGYRRDTERFYKAADVLVFTSLVEETLPFVVLEAMAAGCPVAGYEVGGVAEAVADGETGLLVERGNAEALAHALSLLLENEPRRRSMGEASRRRVEEYYSLERMLDSFERLYEEMLSNNNDR